MARETLAQPAGEGVAPLDISEFMAVNLGFLTDEDGDYSDWIEIHNPTGESVSLAGWHVTDRADDPTKWRFPSAADYPGVELEPGGFLLIFASGKDRAVAGAPLHTNFRLDITGEYLGLVAPDGVTIVHAYAPAYPQQQPDFSYGLEFAASSLTGTGRPVEVLIPTSGPASEGWTQPDFEPGDAWLTTATGIEYNVADVRIAGELLAELDASRLMDVARASGNTTASVSVWPNRGWLGNLRAEPGAEPVLETLGGVAAVTFDGVRDWMRSARNVPETATGNDDWSIEVWALNPEIGAKETMASWTVHRGPGGKTALLNYGSGEGGAIEHWGSRDMSYAGGPPTTGTWHHIAVTYTGGVAGSERVYVDGVLNTSQTTRLTLHGLEDEYFFPLLLGASSDSDALTTLKSRFSGSLAVVRFHGGALTAEEVQTNFYADARSFGIALPDDARSASPPIGGNVESRMRGVTATAYLRAEFEVEDLAGIGAPALRMRYDDGFVAYLNGAEVARRNAPVAPSWNSSATAPAPPRHATAGEFISLAAHAAKLRPGRNVLAVQGLNLSASDSDFRLLPELLAVSPDRHAGLRFATPSPGAPNAITGPAPAPLIGPVRHSPNLPSAAGEIVVTARVRPVLSPVTDVLLTYRAMYDAETTLTMRDDGVAPDVLAGDDVYSATIPAGAAEPGEMVRWFVTARDQGNGMARQPFFQDAAGSPEYLGTMIADSVTTSAMPIYHWFIEPENMSASDTRSGARCSVFYAGRFYDNVFCRLRGFTSVGYNKKSHRFNFNKGFYCYYADDAKPIEKVNLNAEYLDPTYMRQILSYEAFGIDGEPTCVTFPVRVEQNGAFYGIAQFLDDIDRAYLDRNGLDSDGALYYAPNMLQVGASVSKKTRLDEGSSDLVALTQGVREGASIADRRKYLFDNINLPAVMLWMAVFHITQQGDMVHWNYHVYRDTNGTGEWRFIS
ncbi:MAG: CotH kinase family protein, partial [Alphaproteobacteria bacterium]